MVQFERAMVVSLHCDRCAIYNHWAAICHRMSPTHNLTKVESLGAKFGEELVDPM